MMPLTVSQMFRCSKIASFSLLTYVIYGTESLGRNEKKNIVNLNFNLTKMAKYYKHLLFRVHCTRSTFEFKFGFDSLCILEICVGQVNWKLVCERDWSVEFIRFAPSACCSIVIFLMLCRIVCNAWTLLTGNWYTCRIIVGW